MADPVLPTKDGRYPVRHLEPLQFDIYTIIVVFGLGNEGSMLLEGLVSRLRKLGKYSHLTRDQLKEMLVQCTDISFLFLSEVKDYHFTIVGRNYGPNQASAL